MSLAHNAEDGHRTQDVQMPPNVSFDTLLLTAATLEGLAKSGFYKPSPIQLHGIPMGKCGFDLLLEAKSGTGKTAVFSIIALEMLDLHKGLQVVILAPTREIAAQICDVLKLIGSSYEGLQIEVVMGGLPIHEDIMKFKNKKVHIVVGSPGRLKHLIQDQHIDVSAVRLLVLDEADRLMEKSFQADINYIYSLLPKQKQVIMSSATYPDITKSFINQYVQNAQHICPDSDSILLGIQQKATLVKCSSNIVKQTKFRLEELLKILSSHPFKQCLIFCNYQARVTELHKMLKKAKWPAEQLYGKQEQTDRLDALKTLQEYKCRILISTDLAARGIDASNVDLVINFEPPYEWQTYLHRIGRAGRFGSYGKAVTILSEGKEQTKFQEMLKSIKNACNLTNLWDDKKFYVDDDDSSATSEIESHKSIESHLTDKELAEVEEKVTEIIKNSSESKPSALESFSDLQTSFASRKSEISHNNSAEIILHSYNMDIKINGEHKTETHLSDETQQTVIQTVSEMIKSSKEIIPSEIVPFKTLECDLLNFQKVFKEKGNGIAQPIENSAANIENYNHDYNHPQVNNTISEVNEDKDNNNINCSVNHKQTSRTNSLKSKVNVFNGEHKNGSDNEYDYEYYGNVSEALRQAGLPAAFGESKFGTWNPNIIHKSSAPHVNSDIPQKERQQKKANQSHHIHKSQNKHHRSQKNKETTSENAYSDEPYDYGYYSQPQSYRKQHRNESKKEQILESSDDNETEDYESSSDATRNYLAWYKQLKLVTKQLELTLYIDELSKL